MHIVLDTQGTSLLRRDHMFLVVHQDGKQSIATRQVKTISLSRGARISSDAIMLAIEHEIDVLFIDSIGQPQGRVWSHRYGSIANIRKNQVLFGRSPQAVDFVKELVIRKVENQTSLLVALRRKRVANEQVVQDSLVRLERIRDKIADVSAEWLPEVADTLRGLEGNASRQYFRAVSTFLPPAYQFAKRSQHPAHDPFNCLLNYAYGMLYGKVEGALIRAGIDPYLGLLHRNEYNRPVLVYDLIEPFRGWMDAVVINLCCQEALLPEFFSVNKGAYWLQGDGKRVIIQSVQDYLDEVIVWRELKRSRHTHVDLYAQDLAQKFKQAYPNTL